MSTPDEQIEQDIASACREGRFDAAIKLAFEAYGSEILTFLGARLRSRSDGNEAFSMFAEDLVKAMPSFALRCSARGYLYTLARNAANRYAVEPHNRAGRNVTMGDGSMQALVERARTETELHRRTEVKDRVRALREQLPEDDQTLLILHIDRNLPWGEIAMVMQGDSEAPTGEALVRETARLRKRFERVKGELRSLAIKEGLIKR